jgi:AcrR family transcriptional regulator
MKSNDSSDSKSKILKAAEKLFAKNGFDGARVDDIAKEAGVNKALIYYYFKSKRDILDELFSILVREFVKMGYDSFQGILNLESVEYKEDNIPQLMARFYEFMEVKKDLIKIVIMESLKETEGPPPLFRFAELAMSDEAEKIKEIFRNKGINVDLLDLEEQRIADFFTGIMPIVSFLVYSDKWSEYFGIDEDTLKQKFFSVFETTHMAYHRKQLSVLKME